MRKLNEHEGRVYHVTSSWRTRVRVRVKLKRSGFTMSSGKGAAKIVAFSPLRPKQAHSKISLDAPYQLKW